MRERLALGGLLLVVPAGEWAANRAGCDLSRVRFAETCSRDVLETQPDRAILLTNGDNDSFPLWYLQQVEGVRRDVTVINLPMTNTRTYVGQLRRHDPYLAHLLANERGAGILEALQVADSLVTVPVDPQGSLGLPDSVAPARSIAIRLDGELYGQDRVVLDLLQLNRWRRPLLLASTVSRDNLSWLWPYARIEGMSWRVVPSTDPTVGDIHRLRRVLMEQVRYAGIADSTIQLDAVSQPMCANFAAALIELARQELARGDPQRCIATLRFLEQRIPPKRVGMPDGFLDPLRAEAEARIRESRGAGN